MTAQARASMSSPAANQKNKLARSAALAAGAFYADARRSSPSASPLSGSNAMRSSKAAAKAPARLVSGFSRQHGAIFRAQASEVPEFDALPVAEKRRRKTKSVFR
jgi:hypothetical protein